jgi:hypothetical protein
MNTLEEANLEIENLKRQLAEANNEIKFLKTELVELKELGTTMTKKCNFCKAVNPPNYHNISTCYNCCSYNKWAETYIPAQEDFDESTRCSVCDDENPYNVDGTPYCHSCCDNLWGEKYCKTSDQACLVKEDDVEDDVEEDEKNEEKEEVEDVVEEKEEKEEANQNKNGYIILAHDDCGGKEEIYGHTQTFKDAQYIAEEAVKIGKRRQNKDVECKDECIVGEKVEALWVKDGKWYGATITKVSKIWRKGEQITKIDVTWDDGQKTFDLELHQIKKLKKYNRFDSARIVDLHTQMEVKEYGSYISDEVFGYP